MYIQIKKRIRHDKFYNPNKETHSVYVYHDKFYIQMKKYIQHDFYIQMKKHIWHDKHSTGQILYPNEETYLAWQILYLNLNMVTFDLPRYDVHYMEIFNNVQWCVFGILQRIVSDLTMYDDERRI